MMLFLVCSLCVLQCVFGNPIGEGIKTEQELIIVDQQLNGPSEAILMRKPKWDSYFDKENDNGYFDDWFGWIKPSKTTKQPTLQQRVQTLELRQKVLFDLARCESLDEDSCTHLLARAEVIFKVLPKKKGTKKPKKKPPPAHHDDDDDAEDDPEEDPEETSSAAPNTTTKRPNMTTPRTPQPTSSTTESSTEATESSSEPSSSSSAQPATSTEEDAAE